jgi:hypothetical protein
LTPIASGKSLSAVGASQHAPSKTKARVIVCEIIEGKFSHERNFS